VSDDIVQSTAEQREKDFIQVAEIALEISP